MVITDKVYRVNTAVEVATARGQGDPRIGGAAVFVRACVRLYGSRHMCVHAVYACVLVCVCVCVCVCVKPYAILPRF